MTVPTHLDLDRCAGVLAGSRRRRRPRRRLRVRYAASGRSTDDRGGLGSWEEGEWTDDTQMALCIAEEAATGRLDPAAVAGRFLDWYRSGPADVGAQTWAVLSAASAPRDVAGRAAGYFSRNPRHGAGNGSLMRTAPVALACLGDDDALVSQAMAMSALTHADPLAQEASAIWCVAIDRAVRLGTEMVADTPGTTVPRDEGHLVIELSLRISKAERVLRIDRGIYRICGPGC